MLWVPGDRVEKKTKNNEVISVGTVQKVFKDMIEVKFDSRIEGLKLTKSGNISQHTVGYVYSREE